MWLVFLLCGSSIIATYEGHTHRGRTVTTDVEPTYLVGDVAYAFSLKKQLITFLLDLINLPIMIARKANEIVGKYVHHKILKDISRFQIKVLEVLTRCAVFVAQMVFKFLSWRKGDTCIDFPDINGIQEIFTLKGGKICPFSSFGLGKIQDGGSNGTNWALSFPWKFHNVDILFGYVSMYTPLGPLNTDQFNLTAKQVDLTLSVEFTKSLFPHPILSSIRTDVDVTGCTGNVVGSNIVETEILKVAMKMCDPVLNEILKILKFSQSIVIKIVSGLVRLIIRSSRFLIKLIIKLI